MFSSSISLYLSELILPVTFAKVPQPFQQMQPQIITWNLRLAFDGTKACLYHSPRFRQMYSLLLFRTTI